MAVIPFVVSEAQTTVCIHGVEAAVLKRISSELVRKPYAPALLP
jgi:hypothetical protein